MADALPSTTAGGPVQLYLDLMKNCLTYSIWGETLREVLGHCSLKAAIYRPVGRALGARGLALARKVRFDPRARAEGRDWPDLAHTMIGLRRLDNLEECIEATLRDQVPGDLLEAGVWRGGSAIFMRAVLKAYGVTDRIVWAADSFRGAPPPNPAYPADRHSKLYEFDFQAVSLSEVRENFSRYGLLDDQVRFLQGWFSETLPSAPIGWLAVLRLDAVMYQSTMETLTHLYPKLSPGGFVIVDDYGAAPEAKAAVDDFRQRHRVREELLWADWTGVYWRRNRAPRL